MNEYLVQFGTATKQGEDMVKGRTKIQAIQRVLKHHRDFIMEMENEDDFQITVKVWND